MQFFLALLSPCQWDTKFPWQNLSDRSFNYDIITCFDEEYLLNALLYGPGKFNDKINWEIVLCTICYIKYTQRFGKRPFNQW